MQKGDIIKYWFDFTPPEDPDLPKQKGTAYAEIEDMNSHKKFVITEYENKVKFEDIISVYKKETK